MKKEEYKLEDLFENQILNQLYEISVDGLECLYLKMYGEPEEIKEVRQAKKELEILIKEIVKDKNKQEQLWLKIDRYEGFMSGEMTFWNRQHYKLGFLDRIYLKKELKELRNTFAKTNEDIAMKDGFFSTYLESFMQFLEDNRFQIWRKREDYTKITNRMREIKNKYPNVRTFVEDRQVVELTKEELSAVLEYITLDDEIDKIEKIETFKLGIKEGNSL